MKRRDPLNEQGSGSDSVRSALERELPLVIDIDRDACTAYSELSATLNVELPDDHPYALAEIARWRRIARAGRLLFACSPAGDPVAIAALDMVDGLPYLEQLSVRRAWMRRGIGRALMSRAQHWSASAGELWLATYDHVPWNRPWYERLGFNRMADPDCGPELRAILDDERRALPCPDERIAMVYRHPRT